jgi:hypothetical protein
VDDFQAGSYQAWNQSHVTISGLRLGRNSKVSCFNALNPQVKSTMNIPAARLDIRALFITKITPNLLFSSEPLVQTELFLEFNSGIPQTELTVYLEHQESQMLVDASIHRTELRLPSALDPGKYRVLTAAKKSMLGSFRVFPPVEIAEVSVASSADQSFLRIDLPEFWPKTYARVEDFSVRTAGTEARC